MEVTKVLVEADLPLILILSYIQIFGPLEFGEIKIFLLKIW